MLPTFGASNCVTGVTMLSGPLFLGYLFCYGFFGVLCVQVFMYHIAFRKDSQYMKAYVYVVFAVEVVLTVVSTYTGWSVFGSGYGEAARILHFDSSGNTPQPALTGLVTLLYHSFYSWRIFKLTHSFILPLIICAISTTQLGVTIYISTYYGQQRVIQALYDIDKVVIVWIVSCSIADIIITVVMVTILLQHRQKSSYQATTTKLERLIRFSIETGLAITCTGLVKLTLYLASRDTYLYLLLFPSLGKLYSNTLMATLNSRMVLGGPSNAGIQSNHQLRSAFWSDQRAEANDSKTTTNPLPCARTRTADPQTHVDIVVLQNMDRLPKENGVFVNMEMLRAV